MPSLNGERSTDRLDWAGGQFPEIIGTMTNTDRVTWYELENGDYLMTVTEPGTNAARQIVYRDLLIHMRRGEKLQRSGRPPNRETPGDRVRRIRGGERHAAERQF